MQKFTVHFRDRNNQFTGHTHTISAVNLKAASRRALLIRRPFYASVLQLVDRGNVVFQSTLRGA